MRGHPRSQHTLSTIPSSVCRKSSEKGLKAVDEAPLQMFVNVIRPP